MVLTRQAKIDPAESREKKRISDRRHCARRRAIKRGSAEVEKFNHVEIFQRDGWRCSICRKRVNPLVRWPDPKSASLDHIVPLSAGGTHTRRNVRLAHLGCNASKSNRAHPSDQLLLVG